MCFLIDWYHELVIWYGLVVSWVMARKELQMNKMVVDRHLLSIS